jgi:AcrR family transcriptional regulator
MSKRDPKQLILDAALSVFAEVGFEHATTGHILSRGAISNGALFHHFPTKDAIAEALYLRGIESYQQGLLRALERHGGVDAARATIKAAVQHHLAWVEANRDLARFMYERGRPDWQPAHGSAVRKLNRSAALHVRDWIAPLAAAGVVRDLPLAVLAACVVGPAHFVARRWLSGMIAARPTSFTSALADAAWAALAPERPRRSAAPTHPVSPAAAIEAAALEAARSVAPADAHGDWTILELTMNSAHRAATSMPGMAQIQSVRVEAEGCIAMVDVDLLDANGDAVRRSHVVCLRSKANSAALPGDKRRQIGSTGNESDRA